MFPTVVGTPQKPATAAEREFRHALRRAGLPRLAFRFHDLRHYAVSQLIAQGASILQVARVAGHGDPSVTLRVYSHLMADGLAEAARRYDPLRALAVDERQTSGRSRALCGGLNRLISGLLPWTRSGPGPVAQPVFKTGEVV